MSRRRLTNQTLDNVSRFAAAKETVKLSETILGRGASDSEVLATARVLQRLDPSQIRMINQRRASINRQISRLAASPNGAEDLLEEAGPPQPDPTNNQAYVKQIMTTPDHAVLDSLQRRDMHAPTSNVRRAPQRSKNPRRAMDFPINPTGMDDMDDSYDPYDVHAAKDDEPDLEDVDTEEVDDTEDTEDKDLEDMNEDETDEDFDLEEDDHDLEAMMEPSDSPEGDLGDMVPEEGADIMPEMDQDTEDMEDLDQDLEDVGEDEEDLSDDLSEDLGDEDLLGDVDEDEDFIKDEEEGPGGMPTPPRPPTPMPNMKPPTGSRRVPSGLSRRPRNANEFTLEDAMSLGDEDDIASHMSSKYQGDDLAALTGQKGISSNRSASVTGSTPGIRPEDRSEGFTWDTENEPEISGRVARRKPVRRKQSSRPSQPYVPDRRRIASQSRRNEFDDVFGTPDVSSYFRD